MMIYPSASWSKCYFLGFAIKHDQHVSTSKQPCGTKIPKIMNQDMQRTMNSEVEGIIIELLQFVGF
jgi:hypothetical protein